MFWACLVVWIGLCLVFFVVGSFFAGCLFCVGFLVGVGFFGVRGELCVIG